MNQTELKAFLDEKVVQYNTPQFIDSDPILIPHSLSLKEDIEIMAFLLATIAWGQRITIINNGWKWLELMDGQPYEFVMHASEKELKRFDGFKHRTFNAQDATQFIRSLKHIYAKHGGLESVFAQKETVYDAIHNFKQLFFEIPHETRTLKHVSDPHKGSASKRINMYLRWMCRKDKKGVDFGLWNRIPTKKLIMPLDVHTQNVGRKLGLLERTQNDWRAAEELTANLRLLDPKDPVKYDFALFGLGVFEGFR